MRTIFSLVALLAGLICLTTHATVYEYELPGLIGTSCDTIRTTTFIYDGHDGSVNSLSIRISGEVDNLGYIQCWASTPPETSVWEMDLSSVMKKPSESGRWISTAPFLSELGPFSGLYYYVTYSGGFSYLSGGDEIQVDLYFGPAILVGMCGPITPPSTGFTVRVSVLVDVSSSIPVENTTWGRIKGFYESHP